MAVVPQLGKVNLPQEDADTGLPIHFDTSLELDEVRAVRFTGDARLCVRATWVGAGQNWTGMAMAARSSLRMGRSTPRDLVLICAWPLAHSCSRAPGGRSGGLWAEKARRAPNCSQLLLQASRMVRIPDVWACISAWHHWPNRCSSFGADNGIPF